MTTKDFNVATLLQGQGLLRDLTREMQKLSAAQRNTQSRHKHFNQLSTPKAKGDNGISGVMFENMLMGLLMESLFGGIPFLSGLGLSNETVQGLGFAGTALHHDATERKSHSMETSAMMSTALIEAQKAQMDAAGDEQKNQLAELTRMKKLMILLLATMLLQDGSGKSGGDDEVVPDVLRDPKIARFKQNRQSISCIKTLFQKQTAMTSAPAMRCA